LIAGWLAVGLSVSIACFWAFWGSIENFHEGWFYESFLMNLALMLAQYLSPMLLVTAVGLIAVRWSRFGGLLHAGAAIAVIWFFGRRGLSSKTVLTLIVGPLLLLAAGYWYGRAAPRRWAVSILIGLPFATAVAAGAVPAVRAASRNDDGYRGARHIVANGVDLVWAPEGPGWPRTGVSWDEAMRRCLYLTADGTALADTPQDIWRVPTVGEVVRSQARHGENSGGTWDALTATASYQITPDKESPLWDVHTQVIYWWTATEVNDREAYIIVYDGKVWPRQKRVRWGYLGFRAVKPAGDTARRDRRRNNDDS
jgi:hypothetical protein